MLWYVIYFAAINALAFTLTYKLLKNTSKDSECTGISFFLTFLSLIGGVIGFFGGFFLWKKRKGIRHVNKKLSVCFACSCAAFWIYLAVLGTMISLWQSLEAFMAYTYVAWTWWIYVAVINLISFIWYCLDKTKAKAGDSERIPESNLLFKSFIGGAVGGICGMLLMRHKTKVWYFMAGNIIMAVAQIYMCIRIM